MKAAVINGSPAGENSITLQTVLFIAEHFPKVQFRYIHAGSRIHQYERDFREAEEILSEADLILFAYPVYTFLVPAQLCRFMELIREHHVDLAGKWTSQITTSKHFYDVTAHRFVEENCDDLGMRSVRGLSADMEDLLKTKGQTEALSFFRHLLFCMKNGIREPARSWRVGEGAVFHPAELGDMQRIPGQQERDGHRVVIVADLSGDDAGTQRLRAMITAFQRDLACESEVADIGHFPFAGGCLGCFHCAATGECIYRDGFTDYLRRNIQQADAIVYAFTIRDHGMGYRFKMYDDRQFCNGHRTVTMGKPQGYLVEGPYHREENLRMVLEARAQVGGNYLAGIATDETDPAGEIRALARNLHYAILHHYEEPADFYGVGGMKIFRDLIYEMQGMMREDHRFYRAHGFYDFPQQNPGRILLMYLVGFMMTNKKLQKKIGGRMTEGMLLPYRKVIEGSRKRRT